jgi:hypothetical protein
MSYVWDPGGEIQAISVGTEVREVTVHALSHRNSSFSQQRLNNGMQSRVYSKAYIFFLKKTPRRLTHCVFFFPLLLSLSLLSLIHFPFLIEGCIGGLPHRRYLNFPLRAFCSPFQSTVFFSELFPIATKRLNIQQASPATPPKSEGYEMGNGGGRGKER